MSSKEMKETLDVSSGDKKKRRTVKVEKVAANEVSTVVTASDPTPAKSKTQAAVDSKQVCCTPL